MLHHSPGQAEGPAKKQHVIARSGATWQSPAQLYKFVLRTGRLPRLRLAMTWLISVAVSVQTGWSSYRGGRDDVQCPTIRILLDCRQAESTTVCPPGLPAPKTAQSAQCPTTRVLLDCRQAESTTVCPPGLPAPKTAQSAQCPTTRVLLDCRQAESTTVWLPALPG